jgi:hypothetical protein
MTGASVNSRRIRQVCHPSMSGMTISSKITSGDSAQVMETASPPEAAVSAR